MFSYCHLISYCILEEENGQGGERLEWRMLEEESVGGGEGLRRRFEKVEKSQTSHMVARITT